MDMMNEFEIKMELRNALLENGVDNYKDTLRQVAKNLYEKWIEGKELSKEDQLRYAYRAIKLVEHYAKQVYYGF